MVPKKTTVAPVEGSATSRRTASTSSGSPVTSASRTAAGAAAHRRHERELVAVGQRMIVLDVLARDGRDERRVLGQAGQRAAAQLGDRVGDGRAVVELSGTVPAPACSRRLAKSRTVTSMPGC